MIISRSLIQEVLRTAIVVTVIVVCIFLILRVMGFLSQAAEGVIPVDAVLTLVFLKMIAYLDVMIPLMFYIALIMVLGRWYKDHEMAVLASAGFSLIDLLKPVLLLALFISAIVALFSFYLTPLTLSKGYAIENDYRQANEITGVVPGIFVESKTGQAVYFVEKYNKRESRYENVFVYKNSFDREGVVVSDTAYQIVDDETNDEFLVLKNGTRYEGRPGTTQYRVIDYETYALRIESKKKPISVLPIRARSNTEVMNSDQPQLRGEWYWRIAKVMLVPVLAIFGLALSFVDPRRAKSSGIMLAFLVYFIYSNLFTYSVALVKKGTVKTGAGIWWVHIIFLLLALYCLYRRNANLSLFPHFFSKPLKTSHANS
ncbi:MAG: LPS export ABC transporter permease LptF [Arenicella sp.]